MRERRTALGFSQENLAHRAGVSLNAVHKLEAGRITDPHFSTLSGIAHALGITVAELVGEEQMAGAAAPLGEASEAGRPTIVEVLKDAAWKQIAQEAKPTDRPVLDMRHANEGARKLREEYGLSGTDAEELIDYVLRQERGEAGARSRQGAGRPSSREAVADPITD